MKARKATPGATKQAAADLAVHRGGTVKGGCESHGFLGGVRVAAGDVSGNATIGTLKKK